MAKECINWTITQCPDETIIQQLIKCSNDIQHLDDHDNIQRVDRLIDKIKRQGYGLPLLIQTLYKVNKPLILLVSIIKCYNPIVNDKHGKEKFVIEIIHELDPQCLPLFEKDIFNWSSITPDWISNKAYLEIIYYDYKRFVLNIDNQKIKEE